MPLGTPMSAPPMKPLDPIAFYHFTSRLRFPSRPCAGFGACQQCQQDIATCEVMRSCFRMYYITWRAGLRMFTLFVRLDTLLLRERTFLDI